MSRDSEDGWRARHHLHRGALGAFGGAVLLFLVAPMLLVAVASLDPGEFFTFPPSRLSVHWYVEFLSDGAWRSALLLSLKVAGVTAVTSTLIGCLAGVGIARAAPTIRRLLYPLVVAPLILPAVLLAISFYGVVLKLRQVGSLMAFVVGNTVLSAPLVALLVLGAALGVDRRLEYASLSCGAGPWRTLGLVTLPLVAPTAVAGGVFAFLFSLGDVVMSIFLAAPDRTPLGVMMFVQVLRGTSPIVTAASTLLIAAAVTALVVLTWLRNRAMAKGQPIAVEALELQ